MLKPVNWKTFPRDFLIAQVGFAIYGLAIALIIQAELGTGPWAVLSVALADLSGTSPGTMIVVTGVIVLVGALAMKEKIGETILPYTILGACSPRHAFKAIQAENKIGAMLPCNVVVQDIGEGRIEVAAVDPAASMQAVDNPALEGIAGGVRGMPQAVIEKL